MTKKISKKLKEIRKYYRKNWISKETMPKITETKDCFVFSWCLGLNFTEKEENK